MLDDPKACIYLDNQPIGLVSYQRATTNDLISRFSTTAQGETNLDLLKSLSQSSFRGGAFYREFNDGETVNTLVNGYYNDLDQSLYINPKVTAFLAASASYGLEGVDSWCVMGMYLYICGTRQSPSVGTSFLKINLNDNTSSSITLPVSHQNVVITSMVVHRDKIFMCSDSWFSLGTTTLRFDGATTFQDIAGGFRRLISWRGTLYGINRGGAFYSITNEFAAGAGTFTLIKFAGSSTPITGQPIYFDYVNALLLFNNALYILKSDGLFRYDGVDIATVFDYSQNLSLDNFRFGAVFNGRLYYTMGSKIFEFDGVTVTLLQDLTGGYQIRSMAGGTDRLWIAAQVKDGFPAVYGDTDGKWTDATYAQHLFCYNGVGFFDYKSFPPGYGSYFNYVNATVIPVNNAVYWVTSDGYLNASLEPRSTGCRYVYIPLTNEFSLPGMGDGSMVVTSGDINNGYPSVTKVLNGIALDYEGFEAGKSTIKIEAQYFINGAWTDFVEVWNTQNIATAAAAADYPLHEQSLYAAPTLPTAPAPYLKMRYRLTATISPNVTLTTVPRIRKLTMRFTLQPRVRRQWQLTLAINGIDNRNLNTGSIDGVVDDRHNIEIRKLLYDAYARKLPLLFYDVEFSKLTSIVPLVAPGTSLFDAGDVLAFANSSDLRWINRRVGGATYDEVNDKTTLSLDAFGYRLGLNGAPVATPFSIGGQVRKSHAVYITQIANDRIVLDPNTMNDKNGYSDYAGEMVIKLVEV